MIHQILAIYQYSNAFLIFQYQLQDPMQYYPLNMRMEYFIHILFNQKLLFYIYQGYEIFYMLDLNHLLDLHVKILQVFHQDFLILQNRLYVYQKLLKILYYMPRYLDIMYDHINLVILSLHYLELNFKFNFNRIKVIFRIVQHLIGVCIMIMII